MTGDPGSIWMRESPLINLARPLGMMIEAMTPPLGHRAVQCAADVAELAARFGLTAEATEQAVVAALLHDLGMLMLPLAILGKPGPLTVEERRHMQTHAEIGSRVVAGLNRVEPAFAEVAAAVRHHHERWDGDGYPDRLAGEEIPFAARLIAVVDAYRAMTSESFYRGEMPDRVARLRLVQVAETQFDLRVVAAFEEILVVRARP